MTQTGKTRVRVQRRLFREPLLVLQVQEEYQHAENFGSYIDVEHRLRWRDATATDLSVSPKVTVERLK